jgi:hypothetical protein
MIRHFLHVVAIVTACAVAGCSSSSTPVVALFEAPRTSVAYNTELKGVESQKIVDLMKEALEI